MAGLVERRVAATRAVATTGVEARGAEAQVPSSRKAWAAPSAPRDASVEWEGGRGCHANGKVHKVRACSPPSSKNSRYIRSASLQIAGARVEPASPRPTLEHPGAS